MFCISYPSHDSLFVRQSGTKEATGQLGSDTICGKWCGVCIGIRSYVYCELGLFTAKGQQILGLRGSGVHSTSIPLLQMFVILYLKSILWNASDFSSVQK